MMEVRFKQIRRKKVNTLDTEKKLLGGMKSQYAITNDIREV